MCDDAAGFIAVEPVHKPEFCPVADSTHFSCLQEKIGGVVVPRRLLCLIRLMLLPGASRPGLDGRWVWAPPPGRDLLDQASSHTQNPRSDSGAAGVSHTTLTTIAARAPLQQERVRTRGPSRDHVSRAAAIYPSTSPPTAGRLRGCQSAGSAGGVGNPPLWRSSRPRARASS